MEYRIVTCSIRDYGLEHCLKKLEGLVNAEIEKGFRPTGSMTTEQIPYYHVMEGVSEEVRIEYRASQPMVRD